MKSVVISSSNRFAKEVLSFADGLRALGVQVLTPHFYTHQYGNPDTIKDHNKTFIGLGLTLDHFQKIRKADVMFVYNPDGYAGYSVSMEIGYATALGKRIYALTDKDEEICRDVLFDDYAASPEELASKLT